MPSKRKRDILDFDPNKSDSEDENFVPGDDGERPRRTKKKQKAQKGQRTPNRRRQNRYRGSDIDEDDEEVSDDSLGESYASDSDSGSDDDDEPVTTATGRRARKAAVNHISYKESSEDDDDISDSDRDDKKKHVSPAKKAPARPSRIVVLKTSPKKLRERLSAATTAPMTRRTRATTEEADDFVELTNSGRHAQPSRASRSKSPEAYAAGRQTRRASKGLKKPPAPPIEEATQEDSVVFGMNDDDDDEDDDEPLAGLGGKGGADKNRVHSQPPDKIVGDVEAAEEDELALDGALQDEDAVGDDDYAAPEDADADIEMNDDANDEEADEDEDDVKPRGRRVTRLSRNSLAAAADDGELTEDVAADAGNEGDQNEVVGRRLTRGSRLRKAKSVKEQSSDFEPIDDDGSGDGGMSDSDASEKNNTRATTGDDDSSQNSRGRRRSTRLKSSGKRSRHESDDEDAVDRDEVAMEAEELRNSSRARTRRRRRSPSIVYEETSRRRTTKVVDYSIKPLDQFLVEQEEEEEAVQTPARRRNARGGANASLWQRNLMSTFGPFGGGGGEGALIGGPWGTGAAGGVDSDSSDDEMNFRTANPGGAVGGAVGMTPTTGTAPAGFAAPLNLEAITGVAANAGVGKVKNQKALADADPLGVDLNVDFSKVGGLQNHINQLKEMVTLPLLYPELFLRFKVTPPRGVLFHGPPGTGKTLLARALANSVGVGGRKITFYMRKGADALSKWVGEAEKQLRLLFEEARRTQPSIIFFDEIDGLAPVRSSKQEQIHASIVSTLLALMDGMDGRGQVIVIGATNRPDNIDPALRRPGRFDREFYFPLPDLDGRRSIIDIHTKDWGLQDNFKRMLAENTKGYGGADLRALCTEAALNAIQRTYPQIYSAPDKLIVDPAKINIHATDFMLSMNRMIPSSERSAAPAWAPLPKAVAPLLSDQLDKIKKLLDDVMPRRKKTTALEEAMYEPFQDADHGFGRENMIQEFERSRTFRPRLLLTGTGGMGQGYLAAAVLHHFEGVHIQSFDLPILLGDGRPLEQVIVGLFVEVKRHKPAVLYIPNVDSWYHSLPASAYMTFATMLKTIPPNDPILVLGTCECERDEIPESVLRDFFSYSSKNRFALEKPSRVNRRTYFFNFLKHATKNPNDFPDPANRKKRVLEELPVAPPPPPKVKTKEELKEELRKDHLLLNLLKVQLQPIMDQIKKYKKFRQPVIADTQIQYLWQDADPNYVQPDIPTDEPRPFVISLDRDGVRGLLEKATNKFYYNLDLSTIEERLSNGFYARPKDFYRDVVSLAKDARNIGDKERLLKANELSTNVEVDVAEAEARLSQVDWDGLYQRQLKRAKEAEEKASKKKAGLAIFGAAASSLEDEPLPIIGSDIFPHSGGAAEPAGEQQQQQQQAQARFELKPIGTSTPPSSNGIHPHLSNGNSIPSTSTSNVEDVLMTGSDVPVPPQWPWSSAVAAGGNTQVSQVSALTGIPAGMSPSAIVNEASTTKTSDPSTGPQSTQATNGVHTGTALHGNTVSGASGGVDAGDGSQIPDTQSVFGSLPSQATSSNEWVHSQMHALVKGEFDGSKSGQGAGGGGGASDGHGGSGGGAFSSPSQAQAPTSQQSPVQPLGPPPPPSQQQLQQSASRLSSQGFPISVPDANLDPLLDTILDRTSGCTVDQLEQISREIMDYIWTSRHERNRSRVINNLSKVFNSTMADMEQVQGGLASSFSQDQ
ncbi:AAA family ATPase [Sporothrix schenckii 1099-18]|uniref:AAA family ATPase n=1 Tax=Sporothrix schenckii 1099-18 TaxID=1397361 RepID=A0A0F2ME72_SPOSC|nr:AAA family ATPase [Sporothrix schenckii 1099-18]KJR87155.1 AAA family ATPase [Sporothrix schenckii 1099-18]